MVQGEETTWNNVQRVNKQNQFVPLAVQTRTGNNPVNTAKASSTNNFSTARQNVNRQTVLTSTALKVNTWMFLADFQDFNGGPVAFGGSKGYITGKGKIKTDDLARLQRQEKEANEEAEALRKNLEQETENLVTQAGAAKSSVPVSTASPNEGLSLTDTSNFQEDDFEIPPHEDIHEDTTDGELNHSSYDKYVAEILKKFDFASVKSMIGSLMYVTASRPDIMFAVCACSRFQVTPKTSHLSAVKRIFRYLKGKPKLGLWYPRESSFDLESYSDSDYAGANLDRKSTTGGCQFLGRRLITWQCKKQTIVATSTTEAEYVAAASCCGQVLWIQNQMLDYGFNFMNTKIYIDNESTICIVKNPVYHSKTKHIAIRHHFIRDAYEKKLIQVLKIHTDDNVADLLTKAFDSWPLFKSKKIAQVVRAWIQSKNSLVKHIEDMRLCRPSKEYLLVWFDPPRDESMSCLTTKGMHTIGAVCARYDHRKVSTAGKTLISLTDDLSLLSNMAALESCPKHNMIAYLEKTERNVEFHEVIDFLRRSYINHALTVTGKFVSISEASIRTDLIFDDADGIDSLPNQAIFDAIQRMGYEGDLTVLTFNKALFSPQWRMRCFLRTDNSDEQPTTLGSCSQLVKSQMTHLLLNLVRYLLSNNLTCPNTTPRTFTKNSPTPIGSESNARNYWVRIYEIMSSNDTSFSWNKDDRLSQMSMIVQRLSRKSSSKKHRMHKDSVSKQGRKIAKGDSISSKRSSDRMTREMVDEDKEIDEVRLSTEDAVSTDKEGVSTDFEKVNTDFEKVSTDRQIVSTDGSKVSTDEQIEGTEDQTKEEARIEVRRILAEKASEQRKRADSQVEERAKFFHDTIAAQERKFLASTRIIGIRNRPPTKNQFKKSDDDILKSMWEDIKAESKEEVKEEDKGEENTRKRKHGTRKKMKSRKRRFKQDTSQDDPSDSEKENDELRLCLTIAPDEDKEVDYEILDKKYPIVDWKTENFGTKPQFDESKRSEEINMNVVTRSFDKVLWGDLIVMFNPDEQDEFWNSQHEWKVVSWKLHSSSGVHTLMTDEGLVVHMLIEKKYPLKKEILVQMLKLKLESEEESTMALELIRFIKKVLADLESKE
ncbi:hypothetical protein Tco_0393427 [Tanacetum coccineum]